MKNTLIALVVIVLVVIAGWLIVKGTGPATSNTGTTGNTSSTTQTTYAQTVTTPGGVTFGIPNNYGLAVTQDQVMVKAYIPPCDQGFDYCIYRNGTEYKGTNFESAGIRVQARPDLTSEQSCLATEPDGYTNMTPTADTTNGTSVFSPLGDAGAGHYSSGALYRLYANGTCTEFQTRIGETQFANYPAGSIKQFTDADRTSVMNELTAILNSMTVGSTHQAIHFPVAKS